MTYDVELVRIMRDGDIDCVHRGRIALVDAAGKLLYAAGDADSIAYLRSSAKPFQAATVVETGATKQFNYTMEELSITAGSHGGTPYHVGLVDGLRARIGASLDDYRCGVSEPGNSSASRQLLRDHRPFTALHHNCSGKHSGMIAACKTKGWDVTTYNQPDHPLQVRNRARLAEAAGIAPSDVHIGLDGCTVPTFGISMRAAALAFARFAQAVQSDDPDLGTVGKAMQAYPLAYSDDTNGDYLLNVVTNGRLIVKGGAEGYFGLCDAAQGLGLAIKITDGSFRPLVTAILPVLRRFGMLTDAEAEQIETKRPPVVRNNVGAVAAVMVAV